MIKIAICEDDMEDSARLRSMLVKYAQECNIEYSLHIFESGEQFLENDLMPDILFLDIFMHQKDGIQVGEEIRKRKKNTIIIYTTNLSEKMKIAFNHIHAFGFLLKPIELESFKQMMVDAINRVNEKFLVDEVTFLSENNTIIKLPVTDIYYFEYFDRKIKIVTKNKTYVCVKEKINGIAEKMDKYGFAMSHQSFVVNLYYVDKLFLQTLFMRNGDEVFLAQKRASSFRKKLMQIAKESTYGGGSKNSYE